MMALAFFCSKPRRHLPLHHHNYRQSRRGNSQGRSRLKAVSIRSTECPESKSRLHPAEMPTSTALQRALAQGHRLQVTTLSFLFPEY